MSEDIGLSLHDGFPLFRERFHQCIKNGTRVSSSMFYDWGLRILSEDTLYALKPLWIATDTVSNENGVQIIVLAGVGDFRLAFLGVADGNRDSSQSWILVKLSFDAVDERRCAAHRQNGQRFLIGGQLRREGSS